MIWTGCNCRDAHLFLCLELRALCLFFLASNFLSLRFLCVLCVSAVEKCAPDHYRRDAEYAEEARKKLKLLI
jgi:hypothetical protein